MRKLISVLFFTVGLSVSLSGFAFPTIAELEKALKGDGLQGWVHGASESTGLFVFTYRDPENFFEHLELPLLPATREVAEVLVKLHRHDEVLLKGKYVENKAPVRHIEATEIKIIKKFEGAEKTPYPYEAKIPEELVGKTELHGKVHAVVDEGKILVIEYKDVVVPVYVSEPKLTSDLYRNDKIRLKYVIRSKPRRPTHLSIDMSKSDPLVVTDRMVQHHGEAGSITGQLVLFPKSPQVIFNVFALQVIDENGVRREYTLVNFEDPKVFESIRLKLQKIWDTSKGKIVNGRNKLIHTGVKLRASGTFNVVDPGQANPQILLTGPDDIKEVTDF